MYANGFRYFCEGLLSELIFSFIVLLKFYSFGITFSLLFNYIARSWCNLLLRLEFLLLVKQIKKELHCQ